MKKNKLIIIGLVILMALIIITKFTDYLLAYNRPQFQYDLVKKAKTQKNLMKRIGGYESFEFSYSDSDLDRDSLRFVLNIFGRDSTLSYTGYAYKLESNEWITRKITVEVKK